MRLTIGLAAFLAPFILVVAAAFLPAPTPALTSLIDHLAALIT